VSTLRRENGGCSVVGPAAGLGAVDFIATRKRLLLVSDPSDASASADGASRAMDRVAQ
jgi:hypothetical protein